jgi:hypothetical protein
VEGGGRLREEGTMVLEGVFIVGAGDVESRKRGEETKCGGACGVQPEQALCDSIL